MSNKNTRKKFIIFSYNIFAIDFKKFLNIVLTAKN